MSKIPGFRSGKTWKKVVATIGYLFIVLVVYGAVSGPKSTTTTSSSAASTSSTPTSSTPTSSSSTPSPQPVTPSVKTYSAGMYKIGSDMPAGEYVLTADSMAYFQVAKDSTGGMDSILSNDNFTNRSIITVTDGQYLTLRGCTAYAFKDALKVQPVDGYLSDGMYKVGVDLPAGEYKISATGDMAYNEVSSDSTHSMNSIVSNDNFQGEKYITIKDGQYLKLNNAKLKLN